MVLQVDRDHHHITLATLEVLSAGFLLVSVHHAIFWREAKRLLGDVCPPPHHHRPPLLLVDLQPHQVLTLLINDQWWSIKKSDAAPLFSSSTTLRMPSWKPQSSSTMQSEATNAKWLRFIIDCVQYHLDKLMYWYHYKKIIQVWHCVRYHLWHICYQVRDVDDHDWQYQQYLQY